MIRIILMVILVLSMIVMPISVSASEVDPTNTDESELDPTKCHIDVFDYNYMDFDGFFSYPTNEITIHKNEYFRFGAVLYYLGYTADEYWSKESLIFRHLNYELINADGEVIRHGRNHTTLNILNLIGIRYVTPARFEVGRLSVGNYTIKVSYKGNVKDRIKPVVKYVKLHVVK